MNEIFEIKTECGAKIQTAKLTEKERDPNIPLTDCPRICPLCKKRHGLEACNVTKAKMEG